MGMGIVVCGLNGCGKSTLGKAWLRTLKCPISRVDGTNTIEENVYYIIQQISMQQSTF